MSLTCGAAHFPPLAVLTPRSFKTLAIARSDDAPAFCASLIIGSVLAAKRSAPALFAFAPLACACWSLGPPSLTPRALAAASAAFVRALIASRSCSATAARIWIVSLLANGISAAINSTPVSMRPEMKIHVSGKPIQLRNYKFGFELFAGGQCGGELESVCPLAAFDLDKL